MNKTENRKDEFDLALENMKLEPEADLDRLIEKRVKQMMTRISLKVVCVVLLVLALVFLGVNPLVSRSMSPNCPSEAISVRFFWSMNLKFFTKLRKYSCFPKK